MKLLLIIQYFDRMVIMFPNFGSLLRAISASRNDGFISGPAWQGFGDRSCNTCSMGSGRMNPKDMVWQFAYLRGCTGLMADSHPEYSGME